ncbi:MAG TPA: fluoride efflux transporter CrcB [Kiritimatiellia bacterium]|nr:fluoride efflux transporter CrcB [Kiritimatiellia bacterium]HRZ12679.1 fluoride efflux transporter CrcB [Kiritimatiellia bacterium]HSA19553.1 fluoride efflux transporter CrcB [Kiritimatiellia bacterium]
MRLLFSMLLVGAGGFVGSVLRYALALAAQRYSISFPHGTLWANLLGCLAIGAISALAAATEVLSPAVRLLLATGICGGFTTMSSFIYELAQLLRDNELWLAAGYFGLTLGGCLAMFWIGALAVKLLLKA